MGAGGVGLWAGGLSPLHSVIGQGEIAVWAGGGFVSLFLVCSPASTWGVLLVPADALQQTSAQSLSLSLERSLESGIWRHKVIGESTGGSMLESL